MTIADQPAKSLDKCEYFMQNYSPEEQEVHTNSRIPHQIYANIVVWPDQVAIYLMKHYQSLTVQEQFQKHLIKYSVYMNLSCYVLAVNPYIDICTAQFINISLLHVNKPWHIALFTKQPSINQHVQICMLYTAYREMCQESWPFWRYLGWRQTSVPCAADSDPFVSVVAVTSHHTVP